MIVFKDELNAMDERIAEIDALIESIKEFYQYSRLIPILENQKLGMVAYKESLAKSVQMFEEMGLSHVVE